MTVYVDDMYLYPMGEFKRGPRTYKMSHMIADTAEELHAMADRIGVARRWFQDKASGPHYDITMTKRREAIAAGAVPDEPMFVLLGRDPQAACLVSIWSKVRAGDPVAARAVFNHMIEHMLIRLTHTNAEAY